MRGTRVSASIRRHVPSLVAILIALTTAPAWGATIGSSDIEPNAVLSKHIKDGQVGSPDIGDAQVKGVDLGVGAVTGPKLAPGAVSTTKLANRAVGAAKVRANALGGGQVNELALDFTILQRRIASACPAGQAIQGVTQSGAVNCVAIGGAGDITDVSAGTGLSGGGSSGSVTLAIADPFQLPQSCANGQVAKSNGSNAWGCANDTDTTGNDWHLDGNSGTTGSDFLGTTDNQPLNVRVNNARGLRIEPASDGTNQSPNVIGGTADNSVSAGAFSATIAGGSASSPGDPATGNRVTDSYGTVGGGTDNQAGDAAGTVNDQQGATVAGGSNNKASSVLATVGGGSSNTASGLLSAVGGGSGNQATGQAATVGGGVANSATGFAATAVGGDAGTAQGDFSFAGGLGATAAQNGAFVWADSSPFFFSSTAQDQFNVRSTGGARLVSGVDGGGVPTSGLELPAGTSGWSTLVNGQPFDIRVNGSRALRIDPASDGAGESPNVIGGIADNSVTSGVHAATIAGGGRFGGNPANANKVTDNYGTIGGGAQNQAGDNAGTTNDHTWATVAGGLHNTASGVESTIIGGEVNTASGDRSVVLGGSANTAQGFTSLAAGSAARALHDGSFVWADAQGSFFDSTAANQFSVRSTGGARFVSAVNGFGTPTAGVELAPGGGSWSSLSDRNSKRAIKPASGRKVLRKLASVPVSTWNYKAQDRSIRHIGPMAQDFYKAFGVGEDRRHIASVDADGVALAAIKGLNRKVQQLQQKVASLKRGEHR